MAFISASASGELKSQIDRPTPAIDMAVPAVGVEVGPGSSLQRLADIGRVGEPAFPGDRSASNGGRDSHRSRPGG